MRFCNSCQSATPVFASHVPLVAQDAIDRGWFRKASGDKPNLNLVLASAWEIAAGLAHLHSLDVIHSDICADNINLVASNSSAGFACKVRSFNHRVADAQVSSNAMSYSMVFMPVRRGPSIIKLLIFWVSTFAYWTISG